MRQLVVAAVLVAAFPGSALGAGLVQQRDLQPHAARGVLVSERFQLVGVHWKGPGSIRFRTRALDGGWGPWRESTDEDTPRHHGWRIGEAVWVGPSTALQYRIVGRVTRARAYLVRSPRLALSTKRVEIAGSPPIITRAGWHADEAIRKGAPYYADGVHLVFVHHTVNSNSYSKAQSASIVRGIELYHVKSNGWNDIGYNFLVDKYGQVFEGRYGGITKPVVGAHTMGFNTGSVGIAVIGDYSSTSITPAARAALVSLIAWRLDLAHVDPVSKVVRVSAGNPRYKAGTTVTLNAISGHRDGYPTSCPGASLYAQLPSIRVAAAKTGLPKLYSPVVTGRLGGPIRFTGRLSASAAWTVTVRDDAGSTVATGTGTGRRVDWTWDATAATASRYTWSISAPQVRPATGAIGNAPAPLSLQKLRLAPTVLSPNGDGRGDQGKVEYRLSATARVKATVQDVLGTTVATLFNGQRRAGKQELSWDPSALSDGWYKLVVAAIAGTKQVQATSQFWVDRTLAATAVTPPALSPNGDGRQDTSTIGFRLQTTARVLVQVLRRGAVVATLFDNTLDPGTQRLPWNGGGLPDGRYVVAVTSTDTLVAVTQRVLVTVDRKPPTLRLLSLAPITLRVSEPGTLVLAINGRWRKLVVKRAGKLRIGYRGTVRGVTAYQVDSAGNRSRAVSARR
jgi:N-acetylmuramoyl-L-alanine amidase-like protein/flagellar hook capping protein FlgD